MAEKKDFNWREKEIVLLLETFYFPASLFHLMLFTICGKYSETTYVEASIIAVWTRSLYKTKIVSEPHVSAKCKYGRIQILAELMNTKSINKDICCYIFRSSLEKDLQWFQNYFNFIFVDFKQVSIN